MDSVRPAANAREIQLVKSVDPASAIISGDPNRLQQVVWNLLSNAIKFTPKGGRVEVAVKPIDSDMQIAVGDSGEGISPEFLPHIFERFRQADSSASRSHGGLGLGLSIVRHLVEMHGGSVRAMSDGLGHGAQFIVTLPIASVLPAAVDLPKDGVPRRCRH